MCLKVLHDRLLLSQLCVEELGVGLEFVGQTLLRLVDELGLVTDSLQEGVVDLRLDVVVMVLALVVSVVVVGGFHFRVHLTFLLVEMHHDVVVLLLLFGMDCFDLLHLGSEVSQLLNLWGELLLSVFNLSFDLVNGIGDFLEGLILLVIKELFLIGDTLNLVLNLGVSLDALLSFKILHELSKVLSSSLKNGLGSSKNGDLGLNLSEDFLHLLILSILTSKICSILSEIISLHVLSSLGSSILTFLIGHMLLKGLLLDFEFLDIVLLLFLLFDEHSSLRLEDS